MGGFSTGWGHQSFGGAGGLRMNKHPTQRQTHQYEMTMFVPVRSSIPQAMHDDRGATEGVLAHLLVWF